jgi:hypothetical protein
VAIGLDHGAAWASVVPVGVLPSGELQLPDDPTIVGWWAGGAAPGASAGSVVIAGHVDSHRFGVGTFSVLLHAEVGDLVDVADSVGTVHHYEVDGVSETAKAELPAELFSRDNPPGLVLITCGGEFDHTTRHYADNVIVTARPI